MTDMERKQEVHTHRCGDVDRHEMERKLDDLRRFASGLVLAARGMRGMAVSQGVSDDYADGLVELVEFNESSAIELYNFYCGE